MGHKPSILWCFQLLHAWGGKNKCRWALMVIQRVHIHSKAFVHTYERRANRRRLFPLRWRGTLTLWSPSTQTDIEICSCHRFCDPWRISAFFPTSLMGGYVLSAGEKHGHLVKLMGHTGDLHDTARLSKPEKEKVHAPFFYGHAAGDRS